MTHTFFQRMLQSALKAFGMIAMVSFSPVYAVDFRKTEISWTQMQSEYPLFESELLIPNRETQDQIIFTQLHTAVAYRDITANIGLGIRKKFASASSYWGLNGFYDLEFWHSKTYQRVGFGAELISTPLSVTSNYYHMIISNQ